MTYILHGSTVRRRADVEIMRELDVLMEIELVEYISSIIMSCILPHNYLDCPHRMVSCCDQRLARRI